MAKLKVSKKIMQKKRKHREPKNMKGNRIQENIEILEVEEKKGLMFF